MELESNANQNFNLKDLKDLKRSITLLDKTEQLEILKIIKGSGNKLTENKNGIFINLSNVSEQSLQDIQKFVHYSIENKSRLENLERLSEELFRESMLKKGYENYDQIEEQKSDNDTKTFIPPIEVHAPKDEEVQEIDIEEEMVLENSEITEQEDEDSNLILMKVKKDLTNDIDNDGNEDNDNDINEDSMECIVDVQDDKSMDPAVFGLVKKNRFTGRKARLVKKCKDITRNSQSDLSYFSFQMDTFKEEDNPSDGEEDNDLTLVETGNELTEDV